MRAVDTNVLVRLVTRDDARQVAAAEAILRQLGGDYEAKLNAELAEALAGIDADRTCGSLAGSDDDTLTGDAQMDVMRGCGGNGLARSHGPPTTVVVRTRTDGKRIAA